MNQRVGGADSDRAERLRGGTICGRKPIAEMEPFTRGKTRSSLHADGTTSPGSRPVRRCVAFGQGITDVQEMERSLSFFTIASRALILAIRCLMEWVENSLRQ